MPRCCRHIVNAQDPYSDPAQPGALGGVARFAKPKGGPSHKRARIYKNIWPTRSIDQRDGAFAPAPWLCSIAINNGWPISWRCNPFGTRTEGCVFC